MPDSAAVLVEPFAAALHGVKTIAPRAGECVAVLGPRRLGMLVVAALAGVRTREQLDGRDFAIAAIARDPAMLPLAVFLVGAATSFATGTSWGTYAVVFPIALPLAWSVLPDPMFIQICFINSLPIKNKKSKIFFILYIDGITEM